MATQTWDFRVRSRSTPALQAICTFMVRTLSQDPPPAQVTQRWATTKLAAANAELARRRHRTAIWMAIAARRRNQPVEHAQWLAVAANCRRQRALFLTVQPAA